MTLIRLVGALLLLGGCGGFGLTMVGHYRREIAMLRQLISLLQEMEWELKYRLTPLPELCGICAAGSGGQLRELFLSLRKDLESGMFAEVSGCMNAHLQSMAFPGRCESCLKELGSSLGRYDLEGQLQGIRAVRCRCRSCLEEMESHRPERLRSYQTLALCAGAALVILLV